MSEPTPIGDETGPLFRPPRMTSDLDRPNALNPPHLQGLRHSGPDVATPGKPGKASRSFRHREDHESRRRPCAPRPGCHARRVPAVDSKARGGK
eukprot:15449900-Alexandrium_andersonii.AAC.1